LATISNVYVYNIIVCVCFVHWTLHTAVGRSVLTSQWRLARLSGWVFRNIEKLVAHNTTHTRKRRKPPTPDESSRQIKEKGEPEPNQEGGIKEEVGRVGWTI
jgi:hypothetical protein